LRAPALSGLRTLHLYRNQLGVEGMEVLASSGADLASLNVCFNGLGAQGARALVRSPRLRNLELLHIGLNSLGDAGFEALASCEALANVRELNVRVNELGPKSLEALVRGPVWPRLERLLMEDNAPGFGRAAQERSFGLQT
jgi:hypothetical protein